MVFTSALNLTFSPGEKEQPQSGSSFADGCPANSVVRILKKTANDSPSPWGEGRVEGGRVKILGRLIAMDKPESRE
jgi:hypothetical protein